MVNLPRGIVIEEGTAEQIIRNVEASLAEIAVRAQADYKFLVGFDIHKAHLLSTPLIIAIVDASALSKVAVGFREGSFHRELL